MFGQDWERGAVLKGWSWEKNSGLRRWEDGGDDVMICEMFESCQGRG